MTRRRLLDSGFRRNDDAPESEKHIVSLPDVKNA
jgi:hypothetical protein